VEDFAGDRIRNILATLNVAAGDELEHSLITKTIDSAQRQIEAQNKMLRQTLVDYDEVLNAQRQAYYARRNAVLRGNDIREKFAQLLAEYGVHLVNTYAADPDVPEAWDLKGLDEHLRRFGQPLLEADPEGSTEASEAKLRD